LNYIGGSFVELPNLCDPIYLGPVACTNFTLVGAALTQQEILLATGAGNQQSNLKAAGPRDLYWSYIASKFRDLTYFFPTTKLLPVIASYLQFTVPTILSPTSAYKPIGQFEWRPFTPSGASNWEYLTPGTVYHQIDVLQFFFDGLATQAYLDGYSAYSKSLEAAWRQMGGLPHMAKSWAFGTDPNFFGGQVATEFTDYFQVYTPAQVQALNNLIDPNLAGGSQLFFFDQDRFTPWQVKELNARPCLVNGTCLSNYCGKTKVCSDIPPPPEPEPEPEPEPDTGVAGVPIGWVLPLIVLCYAMLQ